MIRSPKVNRVTPYDKGHGSGPESFHWENSFAYNTNTALTLQKHLYDHKEEHWLGSDAISTNEERGRAAKSNPIRPLIRVPTDSPLKEEYVAMHCSDRAQTLQRKHRHNNLDLYWIFLLSLQTLLAINPLILMTSFQQNFV